MMSKAFKINGRKLASRLGTAFAVCEKGLSNPAPLRRVRRACQSNELPRYWGVKTYGKKVPIETYRADGSRRIHKTRGRDSWANFIDGLEGQRSCARNVTTA